MLQFTCIKCSPTTKIYYTYKGRQLYRFVTTRSKGEHWGWETSDYSDMSGNSTSWTNAEEEDVDCIILSKDPNKSKICTSCKKEKPIGQFKYYKEKKCFDPYCYSCTPIKDSH